MAHAKGFNRVGYVDCKGGDPHRTANELASNDGCRDDRGLIRVVDPVGKLNIVERA